MMRIVGLGTHILETPRVRRLIERHAEKFFDTVYTPRELAYCRDRTHSTEYYAAFWAGKEAVFRSLGTKWRHGIDWRDVQIVCEKATQPRVEITGPTRDRMETLGVTGIIISFSYSRLFATATAISLSG